jgi:hypothetical protein
VSHRLPVVVLLALLVAFVAVSSASAARSARSAVAKVALTQLKVSGQRVTVAGRVVLPVNSAAQRARTRVAFTLTDAKRKREQFAARIDGKRAFKLTRTTKLTGRLTLSARVSIGGRLSGRSVARSFTVKAAARRPSGAGGGATAPGSGGGTAPTTPGPAQPAPTPTQGTPLVGLLKLDEGKQSSSGRLSGTYFRMYGVTNADSTALDKNYTLLRPGVDGGLRTDAYQGPPAPAFDGVDPVSGEPNRNALANRIVLPQKFFNIDFSIVTAPLDLQERLPDPLPQIVAHDGQLGGQISAWTAQWNGLSFNQGSPKPDGSYSDSPQINGGGTTRLTGTYDQATRRFVLTWRSLINGGPFNRFVGEWHLEGTFEPTT